MLLLTGPPAVGKTTCARRLAARRQRCAVVDVDDVRLMVVGGHAAPWDGREGAAQHRLGAENACRLATSFVAYGLDVVLVDVVTPAVWPIYAERLPGAVVVHLRIDEPEARRRFDSRQRYLTDRQFTDLWRQDGQTRLPGAHDLVVDDLSLEDQVAAIEAIWAMSAVR